MNQSNQIHQIDEIDEIDEKDEIDVFQGSLEFFLKSKITCCLTKLGEIVNMLQIKKKVKLFINV